MRVHFAINITAYLGYPIGKHASKRFEVDGETKSFLDPFEPAYE